MCELGRGGEVVVVVGVYDKLGFRLFGSLKTPLNIVLYSNTLRIMYAIESFSLLFNEISYSKATQVQQTSIRLGHAPLGILTAVNPEKALG